MGSQRDYCSHRLVLLGGFGFVFVTALLNEELSYSLKPLRSIVSSGKHHQQAITECFQTFVLPPLQFRFLLDSTDL